MDEHDVLVVAAPGAVQDVILSTTAAQDLRATVATELEQVAARWETAATVFVADDYAERVAGRALPHRDGVFVVGGDEATLARWSAPIGARVIPLPEGAAWLGAVLDEGTGRSGAPVIAVLGGSGGVGASTLAAGIAQAGASRESSAALVDVDVLGGGIDLLMGVEQWSGWRWPSLRGAEGYVGDLSEYLPRVDGVSVLSMAREAAADLSREPLAAIVQSLRRSHGVVVVDVGRSLTAAAREAVRLATHRYLLVAPGVRLVASADQVVRAHRHERVEVVLRRGRGSAAAVPVVREVLGCDVVATLPNDQRLAPAADRGDPPLRVTRRAYRRTCRALLDRAVMAAGSA